MIWENMICKKTGKVADDSKCIRCVLDGDEGRGCIRYDYTVNLCRRCGDVPYEDKVKAEKRARTKKMCGCLTVVAGLAVSAAAAAFDSTVLALVAALMCFVGMCLVSMRLMMVLSCIVVAWSAADTVVKAVHNLAEKDD